MPLQREEVIAWWSPDPRGVIPLDGLQISRSTRRSLRRFDIRVDTAFEEVIDRCADPSRPGRWISGAVRDAYVRLHELGWAHSVESWSLDEGTLAGGLYGVAIGGLFAGESMFHRAMDASKVALVALVERMRDDGTGGAGRLLDVQWLTPHLESVGAIEVSRDRYMRMLGDALELALPATFT